MLEWESACTPHQQREATIPQPVVTTEIHAGENGMQPHQYTGLEQTAADTETTKKNLSDLYLQLSVQSDHQRTQQGQLFPGVIPGALIGWERHTSQPHITRSTRWHLKSSVN